MPCYIFPSKNKNENGRWLKIFEMTIFSLVIWNCDYELRNCLGFYLQECNLEAKPRAARCHRQTLDTAMKSLASSASHSDRYKVHMTSSFLPSRVKIILFLQSKRKFNSKVLGLIPWKHILQLQDWSPKQIRSAAPRHRLTVLLRFIKYR